MRPAPGDRGQGARPGHAPGRPRHQGWFPRGAEAPGARGGHGGRADRRPAPCAAHAAGGQAPVRSQRRDRPVRDALRWVVVGRGPQPVVPCRQGHRRGRLGRAADHGGPPPPAGRDPGAGCTGRHAASPPITPGAGRPAPGPPAGSSGASGRRGPERHRRLRHGGRGCAGDRTCRRPSAGPRRGIGHHRPAPGGRHRRRR